jgi:hypothetical protein
MIIGDLVTRSPPRWDGEDGIGIVVGWWNHVASGRKSPIVLWPDGSCKWIMAHKVELIGENR